MYINADMQTEIKMKLNVLIQEFETALYDQDEIFLENMKSRNRGGDDISKYAFWEWPQGVGLFGFWKYYKETGDIRLKQKVVDYYEKQLITGLPSKNINTTAPMLTLTYLYEETKDERYGALCREWAEWLIDKLPRTDEGGFQHITSDTENRQELWDDTLFMTVLFLARMGMLEHNDNWIEEAIYQFLLHIKYLQDKVSGLWFHGWTFETRDNFAEAFWGRGNSWATIAIPELLTILGQEGNEAYKRYLIAAQKRQIEALEKHQDKNGMWHTLIDDPDSYTETSATCGFGYGILLSVKMGIVSKEYLSCATKALIPVLESIDASGVVHGVSYGTAMGRHHKQFYKDIEIKSMPYGSAMAILFLLEVSKSNIKEDVL